MLENTPVYVPKAWVDPEPDRNDGNCEEPYDCLGMVVDFLILAIFLFVELLNTVVHQL